MNEWNESDWFRTWMAIARQGQNAMRRSEGLTEAPLPDRQSASPAEAQEHATNPELQVTE